VYPKVQPENGSNNNHWLHEFQIFAQFFTDDFYFSKSVRQFETPTLDHPVNYE